MKVSSWSSASLRVDAQMRSGEGKSSPLMSGSSGSFAECLQVGDPAIVDAIRRGKKGTNNSTPVAVVSADHGIGDDAGVELVVIFP